MQEEGVGDRGEAVEGLGVGDGDRLVAAVAGGHDEGTGVVVVVFIKEQRVQGGVREHDAELGQAGSDGGGEGRGVVSFGAAAEQDDGAIAAGEGEGLGVVDMGEAAGVVEGGDHEGEGLIASAFKRPEAGDGGFVAGVAGEVEAADPFEGDDPAEVEGLAGLGESGLAAGPGAGGVGMLGGPRRVGGGDEPEGRPATRAGDRLGVEAAVEGVLVFPAARRAEGEAGHRGVGAVVRQALEDGEARAAIGAVEEGVAVAAIGRVGKLAEAGVASGDVGRDGGDGRGVGSAGEDGEADCGGVGGDRLVGDRHEGGERRGVIVQGEAKGVDLIGRPLDLDDDAGGIVGDPAGQAEAVGRGVDERAKADPLDDPLDEETAALGEVGGGEGHWDSGGLVLRFGRWDAIRGWFHHGVGRRGAGMGLWRETRAASGNPGVFCGSGTHRGVGEVP